MGQQVAPQFVTIEQLGEALKQVQEAVIKGVCEQIKIPNPQPRAEAGSAFEGSTRQIGGARQALRRASISIAPSRSITTPYMSREKEAAWYMEQENPLARLTPCVSSKNSRILQMGGLQEGNG